MIPKAGFDSGSFIFSRTLTSRRLRDSEAAARDFEAMGRRRNDAYQPDPDRQQAYDELYAGYAELYEYFGTENDIMHRLRRRRDQFVLFFAPFSLSLRGRFLRAPFRREFTFPGLR